MAMSQVCAKCGKPLTEGYRFCSNCGASVASGSVAAAPEPVPPTEQAPMSVPDAPAQPTLYGPQAPPPQPLSGPSRLSTMRPDPKEGGMYVPYGTEATTHLEKANRAPTRISPIIVVAGALLLALAGLTAFLLFSPTEEERVKQVVHRSNEEQIKAWRDLDIEVLKGSRTGPVLAENIAYVEDLKKKNMYAVPVLGSLDIKEVKIEGDSATVRTIETWSVTFYNRQDNKVVDSQPPQTLAETYFMVKQNGKWLVERLDFGQNP